MQPNLLLLKDFYRRWWWAYLLGFLLFSVIGAAFSFTKTHSMLPMGGGIFLGALLLAADLNFRTNARTLLTLPVSLNELGVTLWFVGVPLSGLFVALSTALGTLIATLAGATNPLSMPELLRFLVLTTSVNAFMMVVLTFLLHRPPENKAEHWIAGAAGGAWGLGLSASMTGFMFWPKTLQLWDPLSLGVLLIGVICTFVAWYRCPIMLQNRTSRAAATASPNKQSTSLPAGGLNGLSSLFVRTFVNAAGFSLAMQFVMQVVLRLLHAPTRPSTVSMIVFMPLFFVCLMLLQPYMSTLRHWRTLPLSSSQLALLYLGLVLTTLGGAIASPIVYLLLTGDFSAPWANLPLLVFGCGMFCLLASLIMHIGAKWAMLMPMIIFPLLATVPEMLRHNVTVLALINSPLTLLAGLGLILLAYWWNLQIIRKRSRVYQSGFHLIGRMQMGG